MVIAKDADTWVGPLDRIDRELEAFLRWHGRVQHRCLGLPQPLLFREGVLEEGELVTAYGVGSREKDPDPNAWTIGSRDFPRRLTLGRLPGGRLPVSELAERLA